MTSISACRRVLDDTETCYLLAFEPTTSYRDGRYRKLEVRLPGHPKYKVRTRKGYFSPDEKQLAKTEREQAKMLEAAQRSGKEAGRLRDHADPERSLRPLAGA
jgi:hypothetical protein